MSLCLHPAQRIPVCTALTVPSPLSPPSLLSSMACFLLFPSPHYLPSWSLPIHNSPHCPEHKTLVQIVFTNTSQGLFYRTLAVAGLVLVHTRGHKVRIWGGKFRMPCFIFVSASSSHAVQVITTLVSLMSQYGDFGFATRRFVNVFNVCKREGSSKTFWSTMVT